jgi:uncharacterized protein
MPEVTSYAPGAPCWVDMSTPDVHKAVTFYTAVLGWERSDAEATEQNGGYVMCHVGGRAVAAIGPQQAYGQPVSWTTYISTTDASATTQRVEEAGGTVLLPTGDVGTFGRLALCADPQGAVFGLWEPLDFAGAQLVNAPGANTWDDLITSDPERARAFYERVFGWHAEATDVDGIPYTTFALEPGARPVAGLGEAPSGTSPHWAVCFGTHDVDAATETALGLGAAIQMEPQDAQFGRFVALRDPLGAQVSLIEMQDAG